MPKLATPPMPTGGGSSTAGSAVNNAVFDILDEKPPEAPAQEPQAPAPAQEPPAEPAPAQEPPAEPAPAPAPAQEPPAKPDDSSVPADVLSPEAAKPAVDDDDPEPPEIIGKDPKAAFTFKKLRNDKKLLRDEVAAKEAEIERLRTSQTPDLEEVQTLRQQISDYEAKLGQYDLAETREFKAKYDTPAEGILQRGVAVMVRNGTDPTKARELLTKLSDPSLTMEQIQEAVADEPYLVQGAIANTIEEYNSVRSERQKALAEWKETRAALEVQSDRNAEIALAEDIEKDTSKAVAAAVKAGNWMFSRSADNADWNKQVDQRINAVKGIVKTAKPEELVEWVVEGVTAGTLRQLFQQEHARSAALKAELNRAVASSPRMAGDGTPLPPAQKEDKSKPVDPVTFTNELFKNLPGPQF